MQDWAQTGSSRREERIPFDVVVELSAGQGGERLEADGLNLSMGGMAMRAPFTPPLGALLECRFQCPPEGELVCAQGEVAWVAERGNDLGNFGLRFVELDTKSATTLRRYLADGQARVGASDRLRSATLLIDGLGAPVDAELRLADESRIVLEQQLTFLQLGRGVEVQLLGRDKERGRIASVELRHTDFDVPTLVFGILLDGAPERATESAPGSAGPVFGEPMVATELHDEGEVSNVAAAVAVSSDAASSSQPLVSAEVAPRNVRVRPAPARGSEPPPLPGLSSGLGYPRFALPDVRGWLRSLAGRFEGSFARLRGKMVPALREQAEVLELHDRKTRLLLHVARVRGTVVRLFSPRARRAPRMSRPPPLRVQRSTLPGVGPEQLRASSKRHRLAVATIALVAVGLSAYALAPTSGARRASVAQREAPNLTSVTAPPPAPEPPPVVAAPPEVTPPPPVATSNVFGADEVPNGQVFELRMDGRVTKLEGAELTEGFSVRIPRRRSRDRASFMASANPALKRSLIINRASHSELTIEFLPGFAPRYQVVGKGSKLVVTIEQLP